MDFKQIQELIKLVNDSNIGEVTIEQKEFKITVKQKEENITQVVSAASAPYAAQLPQSAAAYSVPAPPPSAADEKAKEAPAAAPSNTITIKSPMIGTFYRRPSPDKPNFLEVGDAVSPSKVLFI